MQKVNEMKKIITFIATTALALATSGEICEKDGGSWTWHGNINKWRCDNLPLNPLSIQRLAQYEIDYLKEYENIKKSTPKLTSKWIQPKNKEAACTIAVPAGKNDPTKDSSYKIFWDGDCKDGYAFGLGREIEKADLKDAWQIGIYEKGMAQGYLIQHDVLNNFMYEGGSNYYGSDYGVHRFVEEKNGNLGLKFIIGKTRGLPQEPNFTITNSPFGNNTQIYRKQFPNFGYVYIDHKNNNIQEIDFNFQLVNINDQRHGWGFEKNKNGPLVKGEYLDGEPQPSELPQEYMQKADDVIKEIEEAKNKALDAQRNAQLVKKQYLKKICKDSVKVSFMDNSEYKEICEDKEELKLQAKVDRKLEQLEKEKIVIIQKQQQEIAQQEQLNIQRQQQQEQAKRQEEQDTHNAWNSIGQSLKIIGDSFDQRASQINQSTETLQQMNNQMYQQKQDKKTNRQLQQINNNLNGIRYGY